MKISFTKSALDDLTCPGGKADILVYDTELKGFAIRVTKAGGKTFLVVRKFRVSVPRQHIANPSIPVVGADCLAVEFTGNAVLTMRQRIF